MKKISILIVFLFLCLTSFGQVVPVNEVIGFTLPKKAEKATREQLKKMDRNDIKSSPINIEKGRGDFYKLGPKTILQLNGSRVPESTDNFLIQKKKANDEMAKMLPGYTSVIKSYNNYQVLILNYIPVGQNIAHYVFFCISSTKRYQLNGALEYSIAEKEQTAMMLDELLKSIKFKE